MSLIIILIKTSLSFFSTCQLFAFNILNSLKLKASLEKLDKKEKIDNFVNPNRLTIIEKDLLKESFKIVNKLKKRLENHFKLNYV